MSIMQLNMFGPPEPVESLSPKAQIRDDAPVATERQLLWPCDLAELVGADVLEYLYPTVHKQTRLRMDEACRDMRVSDEHVRHLVEDGSLDATDERRATSTQPSYRIYRYSVIKWLFNREFVASQTRCNINQKALNKCLTAADILRKRK